MELDTRGYACPIPVVMVQKAMKQQEHTTLEVLADNEAAKENITRFAASQHYTISCHREGADYRLTIGK